MKNFIDRAEYLIGKALAVIAVTFIAAFYVYAALLIAF